MRTTLFAVTILAAAGADSVRADVDLRVGAGAACFSSSIQAAINAAPASGTTNIRIARNVAYNAQQLDINGRNVRLIGGYADCNQVDADATRTVLSGAGGGANTVVTVRGATNVVAFYNLEVTGGDEVTSNVGRGGGFTVAGGPHALVYFSNVLIHDNRAGYGGGIYIDNEATADAADVFVHLDDRVSINGNYGAYGGGGIWCRNARVHMTGSGSFVIFNTTSSATDILGPGGGIRAQNCEMNLASGGLLGSVAFNSAGGAGGGISVTGERAIVKLYTRSSNVPTSINDNTALGVGGGIDIGSSAHVTGWDAVIDGNHSEAGGGAVSVFDNDDPPDATFAMHGTLDGAPSDPAFGGVAVLCATGLDCNRISDNQASSGSSQRDGAAVRVSAASGFSNRANPRALLQGTKISGNAGDTLIRLITDTVGLAEAAAILDGALVSGNSIAGNLLYNPNENFNGSSGYFSITASTIAGNAIGGANVIRDNASTSLRKSVVWQPGKRVLSLVSGNLQDGDVDYLLASDLAGIPVSTHNLVVDPQFEDSASGDFHLQVGSPAIDFAPGAGDQEGDHMPRVIDLAPVANEFGAQDLGAFERQFVCAADTIYCNGFEP